MVKLNLKKIIGPQKEGHAMLMSLVAALPQPVWITDGDGAVVLGSPTDHAESTQDIWHEGEQLGAVHGSAGSTAVVAPLLEHLLMKEAGQKRLGAEVLSLYHEINIIFNFSEQLAKTIDTEGIARAALQKAMDSIAADEGLIVLWDDQERHLQIPASSGEGLLHHEAIRRQPATLLKIGLSGHSEIVTELETLRQQGIIAPGVSSLVYAAMKVKHRIMGAIILVGRQKEQFSAGQLKLLVTLALQSSAAIESSLLYEKNIAEARSREETILRIHEATKRFVPHEFIMALGRNKITEVKLGDQAEKIVTVLFTDIRDYTSISEKLTPEETFRLINAFNAMLGPIISRNNGFVNQYQGDSIMAIFPGNARDALQAAVAMQQAIREFSAIREAQGLPAIRAGIGMHTGPLIMGITGDEMRMSNTTIADTVNTAARIESLTKHYSCAILLSEDTYREISRATDFDVRHLGSVRLKGKRKLLNILECINGFSEPVYAVRKANLPLFAVALQAYHRGDFADAAKSLEQVLDADANDSTARFFLQHAERYLLEGVPKGWDGIHDMVAK